MEERALEEYENHDMTKPQRLVDPPQVVNTYKRRLDWARQIIQDEEKYGAPDGTSKERKRPQTHSSYAALLCDIVDVDPSSYEEAVKKKEWKEVMIEEYRLIMENDIQDVVSRSE